MQRNGISRDVVQKQTFRQHRQKSQMLIRSWNLESNWDQTETRPPIPCCLPTKSCLTGYAQQRGRTWWPVAIQASGSKNKLLNNEVISQTFKSLAKGKTQRTSTKKVVTSCPTPETTPSFLGFPLWRRQFWRDRRAWWAGLATWRPLPQKFSLTARGLLTEKSLITLFLHDMQSSLGWSGYYLLLATATSCPQNNLTQVWFYMLLFPAKSNPFFEDVPVIYQVRNLMDKNETPCSNFLWSDTRHLYSPAIASIIQHKAHDCRPNTDLTASGLLSIATNYPWALHTGSKLQHNQISHVVQTVQ